MNRTATISGTGKPNSTIIIGDDRDVPVDADGKWSATLTNLNYGDNTIHLENWVDQKKDSEKDLIVTLSVGALDAAATATTVNTDDITISGTGQAGATITITDEQGTTLATRTAHAITGRYSATVAAPHAAGTHTFTVTQTINTVEAGTATVDFNYGTGVSVTKPVPDLIHPGGPIDFGGRGEPSGTITITEEGKPGVIAGGTVLANGNWALNNVNLDNTEHKLVVTQVSKGNNKTTAKITLNPGSTGVTQPFELTTPKDGAAIVSPTNSVDFSGKGTTGSKVEIMNTFNDRVVASATVATDGTWKSNGILGFGEQKLRAKVTLPNGTIQNTWFTITVKATDGVTAPFELTAPKNGDTVIAPNNQVDFTGKGTTGSKVEIVNTFNNRVIGTTTADDKGAWKIPGAVGFGVQNLKAVITLANGTKNELPLTITVNASEGVVKDFALTTPRNGDTVVAPDNSLTFKGEGATGAKVEIWTVNGDSSRVVATATVNGRGEWTTGKGFLSHQAYNLQARYILEGKTTLTPFSITVVKSADVINAFELTSPKDGSTVVTPTGVVTFTGKGASGSKVQIINDLGGPYERVVASATVKADGTWSGTGALNPNQKYPLWYTHVAGDKGGADADGTFTITTTPTK